MQGRVWTTQKGSGGAVYTHAMARPKITSNTEFTMAFEMKDKVVRTFKVQAKDIAEARAILQSHIEQCLDQLENEDKIAVEEAKKKNPTHGPDGPVTFEPDAETAA